MHKFKIYFSCVFVVAFLTMIITQIFLKSDFYKNKLSTLHKMESLYVFSEQDIKKGYIVVEIINPSENLFLLQNGEKTKTLNREKMRIDISDNSVIEIDGRNMQSSCNVKIIEMSDNVGGFYEEDATVEFNIAILGRFFIK